MPPSAICVQTLSDIHAEFGPHALPRPADVDTGADIVIIAGDLAAAPNNVETAARLFPAAAALVLIGGNHEHYRTDLPIDEGLDLMWWAAAEISAREDRVMPCWRTPAQCCKSVDPRPRRRVFYHSRGRSSPSRVARLPWRCAGLAA